MSANTLHLIIGAPASGKTSFARQLAARTRSALIDIDIATEPVVRAALATLSMDPDDRDSPRFKEIFRDPIYSTLFQLAESNLPHTSVALTGPFTRELQNPRWPEELRRSIGVPCQVQVYYVHCDPAIRFRRMKDRANPRDASKLEDWHEHESYYGKQDPPRFRHIAVDTGQADYFIRFVASTTPPDKE